MKVKALASMAIPIAAASVAAMADSANAAAITGPGTFDFSGAVNVSLIDDGDGTPDAGDFFLLDFLPEDGEDGEIATLFMNEATGGFSEFGMGVSPGDPNVSVIADLQVPFFGGEISPAVDPFIILLDPAVDPAPVFSDNLTADADFFILEFVGDIDTSQSVLPNGQPNTTLSFDVQGTFVSETGETLPGFGIFTSQFQGFTEEETLAAILEGFEDQSFSASFEAEPEVVPEPGTILGLAFTFGSGLFLKKRKSLAKDS